MNQIQYFPPDEIVATIEVTIDLPHELQVFGSINGPAVIAKIRGVLEEGDIISAGEMPVSSVRL